MTWDFAESNPLGSPQWNCFSHQVRYLANVVALSPATRPGEISSAWLRTATMSELSDIVVSTDPPYYDNIGYADLSDFFYVWLRKALRNVWPDLFRRVSTPKEEELVATPFRHGGQRPGSSILYGGMSRALANMVRIARKRYSAQRCLCIQAVRSSGRRSHITGGQRFCRLLPTRVLDGWNMARTHGIDW